MGMSKRRNVGDLVPAFSANGSFRLEIAPEDGVVKRIDFYLRGDHTTLITTGATDGQANTINYLQVTAPRIGGLSPVIWNVRPIDLIHITSFFDGQRVANANPAADAGVHYDMFSVFFAPPARLVDTPDEWGLDTAELAGPIIVEGNYGPVTSIGTGSTAISQDVSVSVQVEKRRIMPGGGRSTPMAVLGANHNRLQHESASRQGPDQISVGNIEQLWALYLRQHDNSATAAQRVDGLVTRYTVRHAAQGDLTDEFSILLKKRFGLYFGLDAASLPAGLCMPVFAPTGEIGDMPGLAGQRVLELIADSQETQPVEVTNVTPAAGDAVFAVVIGAQLSSAARSIIARQRGGAVQAAR